MDTYSQSSSNYTSTNSSTTSTPCGNNQAEENMDTTQTATTLEAESTSGKYKKKQREVEFRIQHPDQAVYCLMLPYKSTGQECLELMCDIMGIVEKDYFGLQYTDRRSKCNIWINKRLQVRKQIKTDPPYELKFTVKFFTEPDLLLQHTTIDAFYKDLKFQIKQGDIRIPNSNKGQIGSIIAQIEFGDVPDPAASGAFPCDVPTVVYPAFFPEQEWNTGIAHIIAKEHKRLKGMPKVVTQLMFLHEIYLLEMYGVTYVEAMMNGGPVIVGVGARYIRVFTPAWICLKKIPLYTLMQVAFGASFFTFAYQGRDDERNPVERKLRFNVQNHKVAKSIFRTVTEQQVFFYQPTVSAVVLSHADTKNRKWKSFRQKVFKKKYTPKYYYDIERTKKEAYQHAWQLLHQVGPNEAPEPASSRLAASEIYVNLNREDSSTENDTSSMAKSEVCWGLSASSSMLAKELLPSSQLNRCESEDFFRLCTTAVQLRESQDIDAGTADEETSESIDSDKEGDTAANKAAASQEFQPLSDAQGKKLRQLLMKIQDERLCNVCMDELISSVFCPCGHYVACNKCAKRLDKCPLCRKAVGHVQYVYTNFI